MEGEGGEAAKALRQRHAANLLKGVYAGAAGAEAKEEEAVAASFEGAAPPSPAKDGARAREEEEEEWQGRDAGGRGPEWRAKVAAEIRRHRVTSREARRAAAAPQRKAGVRPAVALHVPALLRNVAARRAEGDPERLRQLECRRDELLSRGGGAAEKAVPREQRPSAALAKALRRALRRPPQPEMPPARPSAETRLPLEVFDDGELETRAPAEWVGERGRSPLFADGRWEWCACEAVHYDAESARFTLRFEEGGQLKQAKRLAVHFDADRRFEARLAQCHELRARALQERHRAAFVAGQADVDTPDVVVHSIAARMGGQWPHGGERELREQYSGAMKECVVEPLPAQPEVPYLGTLAHPDDEPGYVYDTARYLENNNFALHPDSAAVLLALLKARGVADDTLLLDTDDLQRRLPLTCDELAEHQADHFSWQRDRLLTDWRSVIVARMRDTLSGTFNLFVSNASEYEGGHLERFVRRVDLDLRVQLRACVERSAEAMVELVERLEAGGAEMFSARLQVVGGGDGDGDEAAATIAFEPPLERVEGVVSSLFDFDLACLELVDHEVVPLLALPVRPLVDGAVPAVEALRGRALAAVRRHLAEPRALAARYAEAAAGLTEEAGMESLGRAAAAVDGLSPGRVSLGVFRVDCTSCKAQLAARAARLGRALQDRLAAEARAQSVEVARSFENILARVGAAPANAAELDALQKLARSVEEALVPRLTTEVEAVHGKLAVLERHLYPLSREDSNLAWEIRLYPRRVHEALQDTKLRIEADSSRFMEQLAAEKEQFARFLAKAAAETENIASLGWGTPQEMEAHATRCEDLHERLLQAERQVESFGERDRLFGVAAADEGGEAAEERLAALRGSLQPYYDLWSSVSDFNASHSLWMTGGFTHLDPAEVGDRTSAWFALFYRLERQLAEAAPDAAKVAEDLRMQVDAFRKHVPLIEHLRGKGLRARHWEQLGLSEPDGSTTLATLLSQKLDLEAIEEVCSGAEKEFGLESALDRMREEWRGVELQIEEYKETRTSTLRGSDEVLQLLDDHVMKTQAMQGSPYVRPFEARTKAWEARLQLVQHVMEEWLACQKSWLYLEPIFSSDDIMRQLPTESRRFGVVDAYWRKTMAAAARVPNALDFCSEQDNLLKGLRESNALLELISRGLSDYLETKRLAFPRFYFLADDELLQIIAQTKSPAAVQPHLSKCFDNITSLEFDAAGVIRGMESAEGERVPFSAAVDPNQGARRGNVEVWLRDVEQVMRESLAGEMRRALASDDMLGAPGQIVLARSQVHWTRRVADAIEAGTLPACLAALNEQLAELVALVRGDSLTKLDRLTLGALTVIRVHARDIVADLAGRRVASTDSFDWQKQLRYYWEVEDGGDAKDGGGGTLAVRLLATRSVYAYEYLGNSSRLVITPLTDRAYATLLGAVHLHLGGAPEGPAGTGKTETVKDLAKAIGIQCVVFNCSDGLDYMAMAKFFKGLASSGAWSCFDEFNRIDLEVLSVVAQQIASIQRAIVEGRPTLFFEGVNIPVVPTASVFITMNPGYAGRSELPDNLKALFRTVAMMVPDYALIAEIVLYSFGYSDARKLSRKVVACLRLSSEQLSSQDHYDFGMRNLKSILTAAGSLKRREPDAPEDLLCLRAMCDCNVPKFTRDDIPLFTGITRDLFPGVSLDGEGDDRTLGEAVKRTAAKLGLQPTPAFVGKVRELHETVLVRHGLMVVGPAFAAKSSCVRVLAEALSLLAARGEAGYAPVRRHCLNPKAVTQGQLYGHFDENTHEWTDGVLPVLVRGCVADRSDTRQWVVFDGPVDALWIENMNTVLDDNKKLCLASGEIIKISNETSMIFEVEDLAVASPATVSRCGMVYMEPEAIGWRPIVDSWIAALPGTLQPHAAALRALFEQTVPQCLAFLADEGCEQVLPLDDMGLVTNLLRVLGSTLDDFRPAAAAGVEDDAAAGGGAAYGAGSALAVRHRRALSAVTLAESMSKLDLTQISTLDLDELVRAGEEAEAGSEFVALPEHAVWLECLFQFALVWSVGANTDAEGRRRFSAFVCGLVRGKNDGPRVSRPLPDRGGGLVYDYVFDRDTHTWRGWMDSAAAYSPPPGASFESIIVPTLDTVRRSWLVRTLVEHHQHVLLTGPTGTGKSVIVRQTLTQALDQDTYQPLLLSFSARTSANQVQDTVEGRLERRRQGVLGPPLYKHCVVFVDDLNMPAREEYGAQPPVELLRQWMDYGGWYDRATNAFRRLVDVQFVAAMGPPGGGRSHVTRRYTRHLASVAISPYDSASLRRIFGAVTDWWLGGGGVPGEVRALGPAVVEATVELYHSVARGLLPTPQKSHYTFNLRDVGKVFQGASSAAKQTLRGAPDVVRLWAHEAGRVFGDRLVCEEDLELLYGLVAEGAAKHFGGPSVVAAALGDGDPAAGARRLVFAAEPGAAAPKYCLVEDADAFRGRLERCLEDYNAVSRTRMDLVLFEAAAQHVTRVARVLGQPGGHALLVGVGGSGRQSLARLAASAVGHDTFQPEAAAGYGMTEWREDLRGVMRRAGGAQGKATMLLLTDEQLKDDAFVEDVNSILNSAEVPGLFPADELAGVIEEVRGLARKAGAPGADTAAGVYAHFVARCRRNLHVVLALSPVGASFRARLRAFPSLVNCCTIDWFHPWPVSALRGVAERFLRGVDLDERTKAGVVDVCVDMQERVVALSGEYRAALGRHNYVTPTSYLELLRTFTRLFESTRARIGGERDRYRNGLRKLEDTAEQVSTMQEQLEVLQPQLIRSSAETEELMVTIETRSADVSKTREVVEREEKQCNAQAEEAQALKDECLAQLAEAMPALENALKALQVINKSDLVELKSMKVPPSGVVLTMHALCVMLEVPPVRVGQAGKKVNDYWEAAKKTFLRDTNFVATLKSYDKDNIPEEIIQAVRPLVKNPEFQPSKVAKASKAAEGFCKWVRAMEVYNRVAREVRPKREALKVAEETLAAAAAELAAKKEQLAAVQALLDDLNLQFEQVNRKKTQLQAQVEECSARLERAEKLIGGLGGEKKRWLVTAQRLEEDFCNVVGNVLVASGEVAYLGVFTWPYRKRCVSQWVRLLTSKGIACDEDFSLARVLGDPVTVRQWGIHGLPRDGFSVDNAVILHTAMRQGRWGLIVDPQGQASRWIRRSEEEHGLRAVKPGDATFARQLTNAVQFGTPLLVEGVGEAVPPALEPLLQRATFRQGGRTVITLGGETVEFGDGFRLYMTTRLANPHYSPETLAKVALVNFMVTPEGLEDQMLAIVVSKEHPNLEKERGELIVKSAENQRQLQMIEDRILQLLNDSKGVILDDEELITTLQKSRVASATIEKRVAAAAKTEDRINKTRGEYKGIAARSAALYFCVAELAGVDPMYQYSLSWFVSLFLHAVDAAEPDTRVARRVASISATFMSVLFRNVCRSLFAADKLLFSFLLATRLGDGVDPALLRALLAGTAGPYDEVPPPEAACSGIERLCAVRALQPDELVQAVRDFVGDTLGAEFTEPGAFDLAAAFEDSDQVTPLVFVLSRGVDPSADVYKLADTMGGIPIASVSLGQGQGVVAERAIADAVDKGTWVLLQNCHLAPSWLPQLERIVDELKPETVSAGFRLWLTSMPSPAFPASILQSSVKMTSEPPRGVRANVRAAVSSVMRGEEATSVAVERRLLYALSVFHAAVLERRNFGALGFNNSYDFTAADLAISATQIAALCEADKIDFEALLYLADLNYGGRVTDMWDSRALRHVLEGFLGETALADGYAFDARGAYPALGDGGDASELADALPVRDHPDLFGFHENAAITTAINEGSALMNKLLALQPRSAGGAGASRETTVSDAARALLASLPANFDVAATSAKFPVDYYQCMSTVVVQEVQRYNALLDTVRESLEQVLRALKGETVMSAELEALCDALFDSRVPALWAAAAYPSLKALDAWFSDLLSRVDMFAQWISDGQPAVFWISGFFFTQSFLTGVLQDHARKEAIAIDELGFDFEVMGAGADFSTPPDFGVYVRGLQLEGASWDAERRVLTDARPRELFSTMPVIWLKPSRSVDIATAGTYECPVYRTPARRGVLTTTGHSSNFVLAVRLPVAEDSDASRWVKAGVAMLLE